MTTPGDGGSSLTALINNATKLKKAMALESKFTEIKYDENFGYFGDDKEHEVWVDAAGTAWYVPPFSSQAAANSWKTKKNSAAKVQLASAFDPSKFDISAFTLPDEMPFVYKGFPVAVPLGGFLNPYLMSLVQKSWYSVEAIELWTAYWKSKAVQIGQPCLAKLLEHGQFGLDEDGQPFLWNKAKQSWVLQTPKDDEPKEPF